MRLTGQINAEIGIDTNIYKQIDLRFYIVDTFDNEPAPGRKQNDLKFVTAIAYNGCSVGIFR